MANNIGTTLAQQAVSQGQTMMNNQVAVQQTAAAVITAQQQFVINSFRGQIYISDTLDVQDTPVYDTITYNASQQLTSGQQGNSQFFTNIGSNSGKTLNQTNMTEVSQLPAPEAFSVFGIRMGWSENMYYPDLIALCNGFEFEFWLGKKSYQQANLRHFGSGWGITGYTTLTGTQFLTNGSTDSRSMHILAIKLVIANQQSFKGYLDGIASYTFSASGVGMILLSELNGLYARGVQ